MNKVVFKLNPVFTVLQLFGLPGLLCSLGSWDPDKKDLLEIYGPMGLRHYVRNALVTSRAVLEYKFVVHELEHLDEQLPTDWEVLNLECFIFAFNFACPYYM